jgi:hypothetical protein
VIRRNHMWKNDWGGVMPLPCDARLSGSASRGVSDKEKKSRQKMS